MIIDVHTHLGDILFPGGGQLILKRGVKKKFVIDLITAAGWSLYQTNPVTEWALQAVFGNLITKAGQARNEAGTLENLRRSLDENGVARAACMPIPPYVTFQDLIKAREADAGIIPFTGVDFSVDQANVEADLRRDVASGARGLKLHPIIQQERLDSPRTYEAVEAFAPHGLPVLFHSGEQSYYLGTDKETREKKAYGALEWAGKLVAAFPQVNFIAGHAGLFQYREAMEVLGGHKNVYVDTSFQAPNKIRQLLEVFGPERVMYASDWPWGDIKVCLATVKKACRGDQALEKLLYHDNAARLLKLDG